MKKISCVILSFILIICSFVTVQAAVTPADLNGDASVTNRLQFVDDENVSGTVYLSLSINGEYAQSDITGEYIARLPIKLSDVAENIQLENYGYRDLVFDLSDFDKTGTFSGREPITLLHVFIYFLENYHPDGWNVELTGSAGSTYMQSGFWGRDENLTYYVNGAYPLESNGFGATSDHIALTDGDFIDIQMYDDFTFWESDEAGYRYFLDDHNGNIVHEYTVKEGEPLPVFSGRIWSSLSEGDETEIKYDDAGEINLASELYNYADKKYLSFPLKNGAALIKGVPAGEWILWTEGNEVSAPGMAKLTVTHDMVNGICSVCGFTDEDAHCDHLCHKTGFMGVLWKIINFFNKLFGINPVCSCGTKHR